MNISQSLVAAEDYYDKFSRVYDVFSPAWYYRKPRKFAIDALHLQPGQTVLNLPCGTGQNLKLLQQSLGNTGRIIGIDLSEGMLDKARRKVVENEWLNVELIKASANQTNTLWAAAHLGIPAPFDAILCDLGLSGFPEWQHIIDNLLALLRPGGRFVIMDWYIEKPSLRGAFIKWIGGGEVDRPLYRYLAERTQDFTLNDTFKGGDVFVASGRK